MDTSLNALQRPQCNASVIPSVEIEARFQRTKLIALALPEGSLSRPRVEEAIRNSDNARLILFRAPAGFGKTTAMLQYLAYLRINRIATAWLNMDSMDDDFHRFLIHLIAAFDSVLSPATVEEATSKTNESRPLKPEDLVHDLISRIADSGKKFTLFLDEFESVSNRAIDDLIRLILNRMPAGTQLAIASRNTPDFELEQLSALGHLVLIDQSHLRFSRDEAGEYLRLINGHSLNGRIISRIHDATEGWPAALWLAATAIGDHAPPDSFITRFTSSNLSVVEYLTEEFLYRQEDDVREFLLKSSILSALNASLCDAVCDRQDSLQMLKRLERSNICMTQIDRQRSVYRYHGLFAQFLRTQVQRRYSDLLSDLHLRAARWYQAEGQWTRAIDHALASGDSEYSLLLLESHNQQFLFQGRYSLLARWLDTLPAEALRKKPLLRITHIWALTFTGRSTQGLRMLKAFEAEGVNSPNAQDVQNELRFMRPFILMILDRHAEGYAQASELALTMSAPASFSFNIMITALANWNIAANKYQDATELINLTLECASAKERYVNTYPTRLEGYIKLVQGRVVQAIADFRVALSGSSISSGSRSISIYLAESLYEVDELQEAEHLLALYLPIAQDYSAPDRIIIGHLLQARISFSRGDADRSFWHLSELEYLGLRRGLPRIVAAAHLEWAHIALLRDDVSQAKVHFDRASEPAAWSGQGGLVMPANDVENLSLCKYRLAVHGVGRKSSLALLKKDIASSVRSKRMRRALKLKLLLSKLLQHSGQHSQSLSILHDCLVTAAPQRMVRTFLDEGAPILDLLREYRLSGKASSESVATAFVDEILLKGNSILKPSSRDEKSIDTTVSLTERELQILKLISTGSSNAAIAEILFVAKTTVRTHLYRVYSKLGTSNRIQAIDIGRRLGLIS